MIDFFYQTDKTTMVRRRIIYIALCCLFYTVPGAFAQGIEVWPKLEPSYINHFYRENDSHSKKCFEDIFF